jgi:hypothetical protein
LDGPTEALLLAHGVTIGMMIELIRAGLVRGGRVVPGSRHYPRERHLRRVLSSYFQYHHDARTHLSRIVSHALLGGLHQQYCRI